MMDGIDIKVNDGLKPVDGAYPILFGVPEFLPYCPYPRETIESHKLAYSWNCDLNNCAVAWVKI